MSAELVQHAYGKSRIRLTRVTRTPERHDVRELAVEIQVEGDFAASYTSGDNRLIIPTDTMKNVAYVLAGEHPMDAIESYGLGLAGHFLDQHPHVTRALIRLVEQPLERIRIDGKESAHAFLGMRSEQRTALIDRSRVSGSVVAGLDDLFLLKAAGSSFAGFLRDRYTTLADAADRIFATNLKADWRYDTHDLDWNAAHASVRRALVEAFANHQSLSAQQTLHAMGDAALSACERVDRITLIMPNKHRLLVDLERFGLENRNEVFVATDEPHGTITGTLERRSGSSRRY